MLLPGRKGSLDLSSVQLPRHVRWPRNQKPLPRLWRQHPGRDIMMSLVRLVYWTHLYEALILQLVTTIVLNLTDMSCCCTTSCPCLFFPALALISCPCPAPKSTKLPAHTSRRQRESAGWRSRWRLSGGSLWTVTGPLLDFYFALIRPYDYISHHYLDHCLHYAANCSGRGSCQGPFPASGGRSGSVLQRRSPDDTTLSEPGYTLRIGTIADVCHHSRWQKPRN